MKTVYDIIKYPLITEKLNFMHEADENKIGFIVDVKANKCEIKKAVETIFDDVKVKSVRIINMKPKKKRYGRYMGERPGFKKAYVTLTADSKKINFVE
jgi:large subunit ribosomal protein L23